MKKAAKQQEMTGAVRSFNISPKGFYEGVLIEAAGKTVQVNFDPEAGAYLSNHFAEGKKISLLAEVRHDGKKGNPEHPVYHLIRFKDAKGKTVSLDKDEPERVIVTGKIKRLNYALHGEVNGAVLENGDFIHTKPKGAIAAGFEVGQKITAKGEVHFSLLPHRVIEAETVNGVSMHDTPKLKSA